MNKGSVAEKEDKLTEEDEDMNEFARKEPNHQPKRTGSIA